MTALFAGQTWTAEAPKPVAPAIPAAPAAAPKRNSIFDYKAELNLSDAQIMKMKEMIDELNKENRLTQARRALADAELQNLIEKEAEIQQIRTKLREASEISIAGRIADIEYARKINAVMSSSQLKKWREIQATGRGK